MYSLIHLNLRKFEVARRVGGESFGIPKILKKTLVF
jgi:hypothetical protein